MANCPVCQGKLKKTDAMVFCENYKPIKNQDGSWSNDGSCEFRITFSNKVFGTLKTDDIKKMLAGEKVKNKKGDTIELDLNSQYFTKITFAKKEVEDF